MLLYIVMLAVSVIALAFCAAALFFYCLGRLIRTPGSWSEIVIYLASTAFEIYLVFFIVPDRIGTGMSAFHGNMWRLVFVTFFLAISWSSLDFARKHAQRTRQADGST